MLNSIKITLFCIFALSLSACSHVQPWEKGNLAKKEMAWEPDAMQATVDAQAYASKESSRGGYGSAGGGCGCN
ncbi:DUF4266 domain-containing protein [Psychromonas sp.]|nr:DUF4266 domain-containing protein [Psychromonas sp.]